MLRGPRLTGDEIHMQTQDFFALQVCISVAFAWASKRSLRITFIAFADGRKRAPPPCGEMTSPTDFGLAVASLNLPGPVPIVKRSACPCHPCNVAESSKRLTRPCIRSLHLLFTSHASSCRSVASFRSEGCLELPSFDRILTAEMMSSGHTL